MLLTVVELSLLSLTCWQMVDADIGLRVSSSFSGLNALPRISAAFESKNSCVT